MESGDGESSRGHPKVNSDSGAFNIQNLVSCYIFFYFYYKLLGIETVCMRDTVWFAYLVMHD